MTPQESQPLQDFLTQLVQVRGVPKDPQADALINSAVAQQPDAAYLLVQRALLLDQALNTAKAQIATLQRQIQAQAAPAPVSSFLDQNAWGNTPSQSVPARPAAMPMMQPSAPMQAPPMQTQAPAAAAAPGFFGGGMGNVLGTVAATAAGVAGGAFLFQGIEHMMHPNSGGSGFMNQNGMSPSTSAAPVENTTINNYYNDSSDDDDQSDTDVASNDNSDDDSVI